MTPAPERPDELAELRRWAADPTVPDEEWAAVRVTTMRDLLAAAPAPDAGLTFDAAAFVAVVEQRDFAERMVSLLRGERDEARAALAAAPAPDAGLREELDRLIGASQLAGSLSRDGWTEGFISGVEAVRQWLDERAARQAEKG